MESAHRDQLRKHRIELCNGMKDTEELLQQLVNSRVLSVVDQEIIRSQSTALKKKEKILDLLPRRGPEAFQTFVNVLEKLDEKEMISLLSQEEKVDELKEEEFDSLDGLSSKTDEICITSDGADKYSNLDEPPSELDDLDGPSSKVDEHSIGDELPPAGTEHEDGPFGLGGKKKDKVMSPMDVDSPRSSDLVMDPADYYVMNTLPRGRLLLVNNKEFLPESGMAPYTRNGTDEDAAAIKKLFEELGFIVEDHKNLTVYQIRKVFKKAATEDYSKHSAFAACVLSHGQEGILYGTDGTIDIRELTALFQGKNLAGKPKMFIFQACQGSDYMDAVEPAGDETDGPPVYGNDISLPIEADFLYAYSTVPGYYSWRNSSKGSWFIQAIVEVFRRYSHKMDVVRMLTRVNEIVATKKSQTGQRASHHKRQISSIVTQLRKEIYLFPPHGPLKKYPPTDL